MDRSPGPEGRLFKVSAGTVAMITSTCKFVKPETYGWRSLDRQ